MHFYQIIGTYREMKSIHNRYTIEVSPNILSTVENMFKLSNGTVLLKPSPQKYRSNNNYKTEYYN